MRYHMITAFVFVTWMGISQTDDWEQRGAAFETNIRALLADARTNDNYRVIEQNPKLFNQIRYALRSEDDLDQEFPLYEKKYPGRMEVLRLDILQFLYDMMDKGYDMKNPSYKKISGDRKFASQEEEDAWNRFLEENDRQHKKHIREWTLFNEYEKELRSVQMRLANAEIHQANTPLVFKQLTHTINTHVADEKLREIILSRHLLKGRLLDKPIVPEKRTFPRVNDVRIPDVGP